MYILKYHVDKMIEYIEEIKKEYHSRYPNNRRIGRYKVLIAKILDHHDVLLQDSILDTIIDNVKYKRDYMEDLLEDLDMSCLEIVDKPRFTVVERSIFKSVDDETLIANAKKILERNGRCKGVDCYRCPLHHSNLTQECLDIYGIGCVKFGLSSHRNLRDKVLVKSMNIFLNFS